MQFFILSSSCFNKLAWPSHEANLVRSQILEARDQPQPGFFLERTLGTRSAQGFSHVMS